MDDSPRFRFAALALICVALLASLLSRAWYLQGMNQERFEEASQSQRVRIIHTQAPRGQILDRNGKLLVGNVLTTVIGITREKMAKMTAAERSDMFRRMAFKLTSYNGTEVKQIELEERYNDVRFGQLQFIPLVEDAPKDLEIYFTEHAEDFPGVTVQRKPVRTYPYGTLASNILGYVGPIEGELAKKQKQEADAKKKGEPFKRYELGDEIGKLGIEASMESYLRGTPGIREVEVSPTGEEVREIRRVDPVPGSDVYLSIDANLQSWAEWVLYQHMNDVRGKVDKDGRPFRAPVGAATVLAAGTGEVLTAASMPTYDPSPLVNGISSDMWKELSDPDNHYPMNNNVFAGQFAPGSTFKLVTAYTAVEFGMLDPPNDPGIEDDDGKYTLQDCADTKCTFRNAGNAVGNYVDLTKSLRVSNDVFYYRLGERFWRGRSILGEQPIQNSASAFGFGKPTGVQITEDAGSIPSPEKRREQHKQRPDVFTDPQWHTGDSLNLAIGQGEVLVSPLQLTGAYATFANHGTRYKPTIIHMIADRANPQLPPGLDNLGSNRIMIEPVVAAKVPITEDHWRRMAEGFYGVINQSGGTAYKTFQKYPLPGDWAGKTGTAEAGSKTKPKSDTSVFVAYGPTDDPAGVKYAASAVIPEAGFGSDVAAPTVSRILKPLIEGNVPAALTADQIAAGQRLPSVGPLEIKTQGAD